MGSLQWHDVPSLIWEFGLELLAETGTHEGNGVAYALDYGIRKAYSIEASLKHHETAKRRLSQMFKPERYELRCEPSPDGVDWLLSQLDAPTLWWLDAHFPELYEAGEAEPLPVVAEVRKIVAAGRARDVIIADDMGAFTATAVPPPPGPGVVRGTDMAVREIQSMLHPTHFTYLSREASGFIIALPRCRI